MLNKLWSCLNCGYDRIDMLKEILEDCGTLIDHFEDTKITDGYKNAAIDAVCELLQAHKDTEEKK